MFDLPALERRCSKIILKESSRVQNQAIQHTKKEWKYPRRVWRWL